MNLNNCRSFAECKWHVIPFLSGTHLVPSSNYARTNGAILIYCATSRSRFFSLSTVCKRCLNLIFIFSIWIAAEVTFDGFSKQKARILISIKTYRLASTSLYKVILLIITTISRYCDGRWLLCHHHRVHVKLMSFWRCKESIWCSEILFVVYTFN